MKLKIKNSGTKEFPFYQLMNGKTEFCATENLENAKEIVKLFATPLFSTNVITACNEWWPDKSTSATRCVNCGKDRWEHPL